MLHLRTNRLRGRMTAGAYDYFLCLVLLGLVVWSFIENHKTEAIQKQLTLDNIVLVESMKDADRRLQKLEEWLNGKG